MKSESLLSKKSSSKPSSTADAEIFNLHRLLQIILETQFYSWRWNLKSAQTTAASETVDEN